MLIKPLNATVRIGLCLSLYLAIYSYPSVAENNLIRLATQNKAPFQYLGPNGGMTGLAVKRVICALKGMDQEFEIAMMPWKDAQNLTANGEYDGFFVGSRNESRDTFAVASDKIITGTLAWIMRPTTKNFNSADPDNKEKYRYGAVFATNKWRSLRKSGYKMVRKPRNTNDLFGMLKNTDLDVVLEYISVYEDYVSQNGFSPGMFTTIPHKSSDMGMYFSKKFINTRPNFMTAFNGTLAVCREKFK